MGAKYVIEGAAVPKVLKENRIRIERGDLKVTPLAEAVIDIKDVVLNDTKGAIIADHKEVGAPDRKEAATGGDRKAVRTNKKSTAKK